jgi:hypothetical protein
MYSQWIRMEHYRMHLFETWPVGPRKTAHLAAARSALIALESAAPGAAPVFVCEVCAARRRSAPVIEFRPRAPFPMAA